MTRRFWAGCAAVWRRKWTALLLTLAGCGVAWAQGLVISPPIPDININGHTYTNSNWQANFPGTIAAIANDIGALTSLYPSGRFAPRVQLSSDLTMYVGGGGASDANSCLVGFACATIQRPFDLLRDKYDLAGHNVTVQVADGTYSPGLRLRGKLVGQSGPDSLVLQGNTGSPSSATISDTTVPTSAFDNGIGCPIFVGWGGEIIVKGFRLSAGSRAIFAHIFGVIRFSNIDFANAQYLHMQASGASEIRAIGNYSISGSSTVHIGAFNGGTIYLFDPSNPQITNTITLTGTPAFSTAFAEADDRAGIISASSNVTFSGSATGPRYLAVANGSIETFGAGSTYFPGNSAGSVSTGGVYN